ncbi:MAG: response regulator [Alcanivoracaceae bacterium]|jgi:CheY-like chemotaxis protein|nr:response regulator [Alcanivoracaceae bacterium]
MNVLIVEDNKPVSLVLSRVTEEAGHSWFIAADGEVALRMYQQRDIDMMIVDVELPGIDGFQVAREVRNQSAKLPIIIISGNQGDVWQQQALDAGANEFLSKPVRPSALQQLLERYLGTAASTG